MCKRMMKLMNNAGSISVILLVLNFNQYHVVSTSFDAYKQGNQEDQIEYCNKNEFRCENEQCISRRFVCDGILDCADGSDETYHRCQNKTCGEKYFQCDYGACINQEYKCDGLKQCLDGSDEGAKACNINNSTTKDGSARSKRQTSKFCPIPAATPDKTISIFCQGQISTSCGPRRGYVPEYTAAQIECKQNYYADGANYVSVCRDNAWNPRFGECFKRCDELMPENVDLKCIRNGVEISCDGNALLAGTKVRPTCKKLYRYGDIIPNYDEMTCKPNGEWDKTLFSCIPVCGRPYADVKPLISGGTQERINDSPWHVAIYDSNQILICGGTIIHQNLIVTAAHCFEVDGIISNNTNNYEVAVSKVSRNYSIVDNTNQQNLKIKEIRYANKGYTGRNGYFAADIALLILEKELTISPTVLPACVDWAGLHTIKNLPEDTMAKVSGWGLTSPQGNLSETLMTVNLPYISRQRCLSIVPHDFQSFVTYDKFCAGSEHGPGVLQGDSGGGLLFREGAFFYLRGIVSVKENRITSIAVFTDLDDHKQWILKVRDEYEKARKKSAQPTLRLPPTTTKISPSITEAPVTESYVPEPAFTEPLIPELPVIESSCNCVLYSSCPITATESGDNTIQTCGSDGDNFKICCPMPNTTSKKKSSPPQRRPQISPHISTTSTTADEPKTSAEIALSYCERYSSYVTSDCINNNPQTGKRKKAQPNEYPHITLLGRDQNQANSFMWHCVGSLISERFILSKADCGQGRGTTQRAALGHTTKELAMRNFPNNMYVIEASYSHPDFQLPLNDIGLYKLRNAVKMNSNIRPACIYTSAISLTNQQLRTASWGTIDIDGSSTRDLYAGTITVADDQLCSRYVGFTSSTKACVGSLSDGEALCLFDGGAPVQISKKDNSCMWSIYAMGSTYFKFPRSCKNVQDARPYIYTKVSYHLDWIVNKVWPNG